MRNNEEKTSYVLDPLIVRDWELKANGIRLEELLAAYRLEMLEPLDPPATTNNADVDTAGEGEGVYFYRIELPWSYLEAERPDTFRLKAGLEATQGVVEGILHCQFVPLQYALELLDAPDNSAAGCFFTEVAIGRLTRYLQRQGYPLLCNH